VELTALYLVIFGISLVFSFVLTWFVRNLAMGRGWVAPPIQNRDLHTTPLPRLGGVPIFLSFLISIALVWLAGPHFPALAVGPSIQTLLTILVAGTLVFLVGIYDDIHSVGPYTKFAVQAVAAIILFAGGLRIFNLPLFFGAREFAWPIGLPITILWVIGITNAFNLLDGLDGLAAGSALFSTLVVFVVAIFNGSSLVALLTIALAGAILGFLRFNFNPATIFLGDSGSLFIGFMLSALALVGATEKAPTAIAVAIPLVSFGLPILETTISVMRRLISGRPLFTADREHIHHKLLQHGMTHRQVVILLYGVSAVFALLSLFMLWPSGGSLGLVLAVVGTGIWIGVQHLGYLEFGELTRVAQRTLGQRQIFINDLAIRRATEDLKSASDYARVCRILEAAFSTNDFDGFELSIKTAPEEPPTIGDKRLRVRSGEGLSFEWSKPGAQKFRSGWAAWNLTLELVTTANRWRGSMKIYRLYTDRGLQVDTNFLISVFPVVLADALDRALASNEVAFPVATSDAEFIAAEAS
jgi:UDP-GlcNAc:undecaprenyl-phosphate/decaprenyl-phosphate GlcNAc-1-phosphate transferase